MRVLFYAFAGIALMLMEETAGQNEGEEAAAGVPRAEDETAGNTDKKNGTKTGPATGSENNTSTKIPDKDTDKDKDTNKVPTTPIPEHSGSSTPMKNKPTKPGNENKTRGTEAPSKNDPKEKPAENPKKGAAPDTAYAKIILFPGLILIAVRG